MFYRLILFLTCTPLLTFSQVTPDSIDGWQNLRWKTSLRMAQYLYLNAKEPAVKSFFGESSLVFESDGWHTRLIFGSQGLQQVIQEKAFLRNEEEKAFQTYESVREELIAAYGKSEKMINYWMNFTLPFQGTHSRITLDLVQDSIVGWKLTLSHQCLKCFQQELIRAFPPE